MQRSPKNKQIITGTDMGKPEGDKTVYFFPKENPPVSIEAESQEEAIIKLQELRNK